MKAYTKNVQKSIAVQNNLSNFAPQNLRPMAKHGEWRDEYWLMLMHIYLSNPVGVKPLYSRMMVDLSMELHISPQALQARMRQLARLQTPRIEQLWNTYSKDKNRLARAVRLLRSMNGFGAADQFYEGVEVQETFEKEFRPVDGSKVTPAMLVIILNLYFQLTPATMVSSTPEVKDLAKMLRIDTGEVVQVLDIYQACDPYLNRDEVIVSPLLLPCKQVWQRLGNHEPNEIQEYANELQEYFMRRE